LGRNSTIPNVTATTNTTGEIEFLNTVVNYYHAIQSIAYLSGMHCLIFFQQIIQLVAMNKLKRKVTFTTDFFFDMILFIASVAVMLFYFLKLNINEYRIADLAERNMAIYISAVDNFTFKLLYCFAIQISCLIIRLAKK
jgi:hypothetical protein